MGLVDLQLSGWYLEGLKLCMSAETVCPWRLKALLLKLEDAGILNHCHANQCPNADFRLKP